MMTIIEDRPKIQIMVALVSDQRMQNIIPIFQRGAKYKELILVSSRERKTGKPNARYEKAAKDLSAVLSPRLKVNLSNDYVDPYDIEDAARAIRYQLKKYDGNHEVVVNISGGTKPMAIGAIRATHELGEVCLYTDTEDEELLTLPPCGPVMREPIRVSGLNVESYFRAYGEVVTESKKVEDLPKKTREWAKMIGDQHTIIYPKIIVRLMKAVKEAIDNGQSFPIACKANSTRRQREVISQLAQLGLWIYHQETDEITITDRESASFLDGFWVEAYVGMKIQQSGCFDDVELNLKLEGWDGEIDVAAISNGKLVLIECKSNFQQSQQLGKLTSLRERIGGPFAQAYYARASESHADQIKKQCRKYHLNGEFFGAQLSSIGEMIGKNIKKAS
jgi:hypothetical protein